MSSVKVTLRGIFCNLGIVLVLTSQIIVLSSWYLVKMYIMICTSVTYKTFDSMPNFKVTFRGKTYNKVLYILSRLLLDKLLFYLYDTW